MRKLFLFIGILYSFTISSNTKFIDFKSLAEDFNGVYLKKETIPITKDEAIYFTFADSNTLVVIDVILIQSAHKFIDYTKTKIENSEFIIFSDMIAIQNSKGRFLYKLSNAELDNRLELQFEKSNIIESYGIGQISVDLNKHSIKFKVDDIQNSIIAENLEHIYEHNSGKKLHKDSLGSCSCNEGTTSCSCANTEESCSTSCAPGYYACCSSGFWTGTSCSCKKIVIKHIEE